MTIRSPGVPAITPVVSVPSDEQLEDEATYCPYCGEVTTEKGYGDESWTFCSDCDAFLEGVTLLSRVDADRQFFGGAR